MTQLKKKIIQITSIIICIIVIAILVVTTLICIGIYRSRNGEKPWDAYNVVWYSEDPKIEIIDDEKFHLDGYLIKDEEKIKIHILWGPEFSYEIVHRDTSLPEDEIVSNEILLLEGSLSYNGEYVTLKIETDKVYDYKYKEIILYKRAIEHGEST